MRHTLGSWVIIQPTNPLNFSISSIESDGGIGDPICWFGANRTGEENLANARLIAAAPELLSAAESLLEKIGYILGVETERRALIAAITKATEEP